MAVYDCCMFLNENDLYEIRLKTHWDFVDKFIVVEAGETHTGDPKPFNFDLKRFEPYKNKLIYVKFQSFQEEIDKFYNVLLDDYCLMNRGPNMEDDDWIRDHFQANYLYKILNDIGAKDNELVYISCLDEIIKPEAFEKAKNIFNGNELYHEGLRPVCSFKMNLFVYKMNLLHKHWSNHVAGIVTEYGNFKKVLPTTIRDRGLATHFIDDGGYHFTFLDDTNGEKVLTKQRSWAHSRDRYHGQKLKYDNQNTIEALETLFRDYPNKIVDITKDTHPKCVVENIDQYEKFIIKPSYQNIDHCAVCKSKNIVKHSATIDAWTLKRFLRLNPSSPLFQGFINHCQDCDYAGFSYRFNKESEIQYYRNYMTGDYVEGRNLHDLAAYYKGAKNVNQRRLACENIIKHYIDLTQINSVLDFGGDTGLMLPDCLNHCEKYIFEIEDRESLGIKPIKDEKVDLICCSHTLEHISDVCDALDTMKRFLKPNGFIYLEVPKELTEYFAGPYHFYEHINLFTEKALRNLLTLNDFEVYNVHTINYEKPMTVSIGVVGKLK